MSDRDTRLPEQLQEEAEALLWRVTYAAWQPDDTYLVKIGDGRRMGSPVSLEIIYAPSPRTGAWVFHHAIERNVTPYATVRWDTLRQVREALKMWSPRCTCGARDHESCLCLISRKAFNATSRAAARLKSEG